MTDRFGRKPRVHKRHLFLVLGAAGLGCAFSIGCQHADTEKSVSETTASSPVLVRVLSIPNDRISELRSFPLFVKEGQTAKLSFRVPGQLQEFDPIIGKRVEEGEVIAKLDQRDYILSIERLKQGLVEANAGLSAMKTGARAEDVAALEAQIRAAETAAVNAKTQLKRMENLRADGTASQVQYDAAKTTSDGAEAQLDALKQQLTKAKAGARAEEIEAMEAKIAGLKVDLELAENKLADTELKAPFNGIISQKYFDNYETIAPGIAVLELINTDRLEATLNVPEEIILRRGDIETINCKFPAVPNSVFCGTIKEIGQTTRSGGLSYPLTITIEQVSIPSENEKHAVLIPGMSGTAEITLKGNGSTILLPSAALIPSSEGTGQKESAVWIINDQMKLERHPVHITTFTENGVIVEDGLSGGEKIVGAGARFLTEGEEVRVEP